MRRGDPPAQLVARSVEEGVGVGLVQPEVHREAPVQQHQHLVLDDGEQGDVDVEDGMQDVAELPGTSALAGTECWVFRRKGKRDMEQGEERGGTCRRLRALSRHVLHEMMLAPSSIGRIELARIVVGCKSSTRSTQAYAMTSSPTVMRKRSTRSDTYWCIWWVSSKVHDIVPTSLGL